MSALAPLLGDKRTRLGHSDGRFGEERLQHALSVDQRGSPRVETVKVQEVKGGVQHPIMTPPLEIILERSEIRTPIAIRRDKSITSFPAGRRAMSAAIVGKRLVQSSPERVYNVTRPSPHRSVPSGTRAPDSEPPAVHYRPGAHHRARRPLRDADNVCAAGIRQRRRPRHLWDGLARGVSPNWRLY